MNKPFIHLRCLSSYSLSESTLKIKKLVSLAKKNNLEIAGEWWFGADFPDLYRSLINSSTNHNMKSYKSNLDKNFKRDSKPSSSLKAMSNCLILTCKIFFA